MDPSTLSDDELDQAIRAAQPPPPTVPLEKLPEPEKLPELSDEDLDAAINTHRAVQQAHLQEAKRQFAEENPTTSRIGQALPFWDVARGAKAQISRSRIESGTSTPEDYSVVAQHEVEMERRAEDEQGFTGKLRAFTLGLPGQAAQLLVGGRAAKAAAGALLPESVAGGTGALAALSRTGASAAATATLTPNLGPEQWVQHNLQNNRDPFDLRGAPAGLGLAFAQMVALDGIGKITGKLAPNASPLAQAGVVGATGPLAQQTLDGLSYALGLQTRYGTLQDLVEGKKGEAAANVAKDALTFFTFHGLHGDPEQGKQALNDFTATLNEAAKKGQPISKAVEKAAEAVKPPENPAPADVGAANDAVMQDFTKQAQAMKPGETKTVTSPDGRETATIGKDAKGKIILDFKGDFRKQPAQPAQPEPPPIAPGSPQTSAAPEAVQPAPEAATATPQAAQVRPSSGPSPPPPEGYPASGGGRLTDVAKEGLTPAAAQRAEAYLKSLGDGPPPPAPGMVRMYRGTKAGEVPHGHAFFSDERGLAGVAIPFARGEGRNLVYVDVPADVAKAGLHTSAVTEGEYALPEKYRSQVKPWGGEPAKGPFEHLSGDELASLSKNLAGKTAKTAEELVRQLKARGLSDSFIKQMSDQTRTTDPVTGYGLGPQRHAAVAEAIKDVERSGNPATYVDLDLDNFKGLVDAKGEAEAWKHGKAMAEIVRAELPGAKLFRQGSDELSVVAPGGREKVEEGLSRAKAKIEDYAKANGLDDLAHTKPGRPNGVGVSYGSAELEEGSRPEEAFHEAELRTEKAKKARYAERPPEPAEPVAPAGEPAEPGNRPEAEGAGGREAEPPGAVGGEPEAPGAGGPPEPPEAAGGVAGEEAVAPDPEAQRAEEQAVANGQPVSLEHVFESAGLTAKERHVVRERMLARSHEDIAEDEPLLKKDGSPLTRQRVKQIEQKALEKLVLPDDYSLADLHESERIGRALDMIERGGLVNMAELSGQFDPETGKMLARKAKARVSDLDAKDKTLDQIADLYAKEKEDAGGQLSAERERYWERRFTAALAGGPGGAEEEEGAAPASPEAPAEREPDEPAPVRREPGGGVQGRGAAPGVPAEEPPGGPPAAAHAGGEAPAAGDAERPGDLLTGPHRDANGRPFAMGAAAAGELIPDQGKVYRGNTALANAKIDAERVQEGMNPIIGSARMENPEAWDQAMKRLEADPLAGEKLIESLVNKPRPTDVVEQAMLLREKIRLDNEYRVLGKQLADADGKDLLDMQGLQARVDELGRQRYDLALAVKRTGTELGRSLQFRKQLAAEDYSLAGMLQSFRTAAGREATPEEAAKLAALQKQIEELQGRLDAAEKQYADSGSKPLSPEAGDMRKARVALADAQGDVQRTFQQARNQRRTPGQKMADWLVKLRVNEVISSPVTLAKIVAASAERVAIAPLEEAAGAVWSRVPGVAKLAAMAPREGRGLNAVAEKKAIASSFTDGLADALRTLKTGRSELDVLHGKTEQPRGLLDLQFSLHDAAKAPAVRAEFTRSFLKRMDAAAKAGEDATSPAALLRFSAQAYKDSQAAKFRQENWLVDAYNKAINHLEQSKNPYANTASVGAKLLLPVVRVPTNLAFETLNYAFGAPAGAIRALNAVAKGAENVPQANREAIMAQLKKGSLGAAAMLVGYFNPQMFGGYYSGKRRDDDVKAGAVRVNGTDVPAWLQHNPLLQVFQMGATIRRAADQFKGGQRQGLGVGIGAGLAGAAEEIPFVRETGQVAGLTSHNATERGHFFGEIVKSLAVPQVAQWLAGELDKKTPFNPSEQPAHRKPKGVVQTVETGVPGLRQTVPAGR